MSTMEVSYQNRQFPLFKILLIVTIIVVSFYALTYNGHATDRHGNKAEETRQCLENKNILFVMTNFLTGRCAVVGKLGENKYGIQIRAGDKEVTSFVKEDLLKTIIRYLENRGYFLPPE